MVECVGEGTRTGGGVGVRHNERMSKATRQESSRWQWRDEEAATMKVCSSAGKSVW